MKSIAFFGRAAAAVAGGLFSAGVSAHHAMDSAIPATLWQGLVSGLAHPIIGLDHLLFVTAMGVLCFLLGRRVGVVAAFVLATPVGTLLHPMVPALPGVEALIAASLIVLGVVLLRGPRALPVFAIPSFLAAAGVAHGYAYGEAIVGAETTPLVAYLAGFTWVQLGLAAGAYGLARVAAPRLTAARTSAALGGLVALAGTGFLLLAFL